MSSPSPSPELSPLDIGEDFVPVRELKAAGETSLSFSGLLSPPLTLHEDVKEGCGGQLWPAGVLLGRFLLQRLDTLAGKTIIELGAGIGLTGLALSAALSRSPRLGPRHPLLLTDLPVLLPLQERNVALNGVSPAHVRSAALPWGEPLAAYLDEPYRRPDVILAADCVYFEPAFPLLMRTLEELMGGDGDAATAGAGGGGGGGGGIDALGLTTGEQGAEAVVCWFCMKKRRKADMRFVAALRRAFAVREMDVEREGEEERNVHLYEVRRKGWKW